MHLRCGFIYIIGEIKNTVKLTAKHLEPMDTNKSVIKNPKVVNSAELILKSQALCLLSS